METRTLDEYISVSGKLEGSTDVNMTSETSGRILQLYKKLGDKVAKGEKIGKVENDVFLNRLEQAEATKLSAEAALETAKINLDTAEALIKTQSISQAQYNTTLSAFKSVKAALDGAKASLEAARLAYNNSFLAAPEGGTISNLMVNVGQYINQGTPIAYITDDRTFLIKTGVGETQIGKLKKGLAADIYVPGKELPVKGFIKGFGIRPLTTSATYPLEIQLNSTSGSLPAWSLLLKSRAELIPISFILQSIMCSKNLTVTTFLWSMTRTSPSGQKCNWAVLSAKM